MTDELHDACAKGDLDQVKNLVENKGALVNQAHSIHQTYPIYWAAAKGHLAIIKYLISKGAKASDTHNAQGNLLYWAYCCKDPNKQRANLEDIYQNFAEYHFLDATTKTHVKAARINHLADFQGEMSELLIPNNDGITPLYFALLKCPQETINLMSDKKIDFNKIIVKPSDIPSLDVWYRVYLYSMLFLIDILISNQMCKQALELCNLCLSAFEQIGDKTENDKIYLDRLYRRISSSFDRIGHSYYAKEEYEQAIEAYKNSVAAIDQIKCKNAVDHGDFDTLHRSIACSSNMMGNVCFAKQEYPQAIDSYKNSINAINKIINKTVQDHEDIDNCYRNIALSFFHIGSSHFKKNENQQAIGAYKDAITILEQVKSKTEKDYQDLDMQYRNIVISFWRIGRSHFEKKEYQQVIGTYKDAITAHGQIKSKTEQDYQDLDMAYRNIAISFWKIGGSHFEKKEYQQAIVAYNDAISASEQVKSKTEKDYQDLDMRYRQISISLYQIGENHNQKREYQQAIDAYKNSNTAIEKIKNKNVNDYRALDLNHGKIATSYCQLSNIYRESKNYTQEVDALTCEMCALENILQKTDEDHRRMGKILTRLGDIYSDINILPKVSQHNKMDPIRRYQNAIAALSNINNATAVDYASLADIYSRWKGSCASHTLAWSFAQFAFRSFSPGLPTFGTENDFLQIHTELVNAHNWQNNMHVIRPMIQFMELLLKNYNKQYFPDNMLKKFLLANESNREWFRSKLDELKQFPLLSLERTMLSNIHPLITLAGMVRELQDKAKTSEEEIKTLQDKNQSLEAQVAQLRQGASTVTNNDGNSNNTNSNVETDKPATTHFILLDSPVLAENHRPIETVAARGNQKHSLCNPNEEQPAKATRVAKDESEPHVSPCSFQTT